MISIRTKIGDLINQVIIYLVIVILLVYGIISSKTNRDIILYIKTLSLEKFEIIKHIENNSEQNNAIINHVKDLTDQNNCILKKIDDIIIRQHPDVIDKSIEECYQNH